VVLAALVAVPAAALAGHQPILEGPEAGALPAFIGSPATPDPVFATEPPRHPFMAPNGLSNLHVDAWQTDRNRWFGPLGRDAGRTSTLQAADCASHTFDSLGRLVTVCVGLEGPELMMFEPDTLHELARFALPPRQLQGGGDPNPFTNFSGGGYFYLDGRDRAIVPTTTRHVWMVAATEAPGFSLERDYDLTAVVGLGDAIISALPDWTGRIWFASVRGVVGTIEPESGRVAARNLGEPISNSFTVDEGGDIYLVSDAALYRLRADGAGTPQTVWRRAYDNDGQRKPGQTQAGSGTTPSVMPDFVTITDNADPVNVVVYRRADGGEVCRAPVFSRGQSSTDNSLIVTDRSIVVENNHGYTGPASTQNGRSTTGGVERVDVLPDGSCRTVWHSDEHAPTSVPKLSLAAGLVYVYTKEPREDGNDGWYLTAIDFHSGRTVFKKLAGEGLGFNNNYAPITLAPDGDAYVGVLGGLVRLADAASPAGLPLRLALRVRYRRGPRGCARGAVRARVVGRDRKALRRTGFFLGRRRVKRDVAPPFRARIGARPLRGERRHRLRVRVRAADGRGARLVRRVRPCPRRG
jgi:hypothetical protein